MSEPTSTSLPQQQRKLFSTIPPAQKLAPMCVLFFFSSSPQCSDVRDDKLSSSQVGVVAAAIPDPNHPEFSVYRLRDALLVYHPWLNELTVLGDESLRSMADDLTHALIRTQQGVGLAGNVFTGGIEEVMFDVKINPMLAEDSRYTGSPAAGKWFRS